MQRRHRLIFLLFAGLSLGTFVFGIFQIATAFRSAPVPPPASGTNAPAKTLDKEGLGR